MWSWPFKLHRVDRITFDCFPTLWHNWGTLKAAHVDFIPKGEHVIAWHGRQEPNCCWLEQNSLSGQFFLTLEYSDLAQAIPTLENYRWEKRRIGLGQDHSDNCPALARTQTPWRQSFFWYFSVTYSKCWHDCLKWDWIQ
jgi:hypothetical protein